MDIGINVYDFPMISHVEGDHRYEVFYDKWAGKENIRFKISFNLHTFDKCTYRKVFDNFDDIYDNHKPLLKEMCNKLMKNIREETI